MIAPTQRTTLIRRADRGTYDRSIVNAILDEALICHVGFAVEGQVFVLPTTHARVDDRLYVHGSVGGRMLRTLRRGAPVADPRLPAGIPVPASLVGYRRPMRVASAGGGEHAAANSMRDGVSWV